MQELCNEAVATELARGRVTLPAAAQPGLAAIERAEQSKPEGPGASAPAAPQPVGGKAAVPLLPGVPGKEYLIFTARHHDLLEQSHSLPSFIHLNLPGLAFGDWSIDDLLYSVTLALYGARMSITEQVVRRCASAWEVVELSEVLRMAEESKDGDHEQQMKPNEHGFVRFSLNEWLGLAEQRRMNAKLWLLHTSCVLMQHAEAISERVLPSEAHLSSSSHLAEAMAIAEAVVSVALSMNEDRQPDGTVAKPTRWQEQAWAYAARAWLELPEGKTFGELPIGYGSSFAKNLVGVTEAAKGNAAVAA